MADEQIKELIDHDRAIEAENGRVINVTRGEWNAFKEEAAILKAEFGKLLSQHTRRIAILETAQPSVADHPANIRHIVEVFAGNTFHNRSDVQERIRQAVDAYIDGCKRAKRL